MATEEKETPVQKAVERNTKRIDRLVYDVEQLVNLLEKQRLVEPSVLAPVRRELQAIERGE